MGSIVTSIESFIGSGRYRPPSWAQSQVYSLTCTLPGNPTATVSTSQTVTATGASVPGSSGSSTSQGSAAMPTTYFFDAMLRAEHIQEAVGTKHPVQVGPAIVDHVYPNPARIVLEVGFSDSMDSYKAGQYSSSKSKSVSAYQTMKQIQAARVPITLSTRLQTYQNLWLAEVQAIEDYRTKSSARMTLHFEQIILAQISSNQVSARPNASNTSNEGTKATAPVSDPAAQQQIEQLVGPNPYNPNQ